MTHYELFSSCFIDDDLLADADGGRAREYMMSKSDQAYADGAMLVRYAFFFVQGTLSIRQIRIQIGAQLSDN